MSKSERVDEIAPLIARTARVAGSFASGALKAAGSAVKSLAKKKAMEKANEQLSRRDEALHTSYLSLAAYLLEAEFGAGINRQAPVGKRKFGAGLTPKFGAGLEKKSGEIAAEKAAAEKAAAEKAAKKTAADKADKKTATEQEAKERQAGTSRGPEDSNAALAVARKKEAAAEKKAKRGASPEFKARAQNISAIRKERLSARRNKISARAKNIAAIRKQRQIDAKADARVKQIEREKGTLKGAIKNKLRDVRDNAVTGALSARGIRQGFRNAGARFRAGRAASRSRRASMGPASGGFGEHAEYQRIGFIIAEKSAAWTRKAGKNPSGGLNAKGVASYRAQNPGSKLKTAVTTKPSKLKKGSKAANRRKSFCARMKGMRKRQKSSNNTGKDRLSLSLKKWNC